MRIKFNVDHNTLGQQFKAGYVADLDARRATMLAKSGVAEQLDAEPAATPAAKRKPGRPRKPAPDVEQPAAPAANEKAGE